MLTELVVAYAFVYLVGYVIFVGIYSAWDRPHRAAFLAATWWPLAVVEYLAGGRK